MTIDEVVRTLSGKFDMVNDIATLPQPVKRSFCNLEHCNYEGVKFDMVDPGEPMSNDDVTVGVPNKRLRFAAINNTSAIVFYEWGGFVGQHCVTIFDFQHRKSWGGSLTSYRVTTLEQLRSAITSKQFVEWNANSRR